jgi:antirestriction protein ArdC
MAGAFICASLGIVPTVRHADYIRSWLELCSPRHNRERF